MKPTVLVATTFRWFPTARLATALADVGFNVKAHCPSGHPIGKTGVARETFAFRGMAAVASLTSAIRAARPDIIVPGDDIATQHLHEVYYRHRRAGKSGDAICALIERSLGSAESYPALYARSKFLELAEKEGVRVPKTGVIANLAALGQWIVANGLPTVLKSDGSSGGVGVRIAHTAEEAENAWWSLSRPPHWLRATKRALVDQDTTLVWPSLLRRRSTVNAQSLVRGREATSTVACWNGRVLAALHFDVIKTAESKGHATVLRLTEDAEMSGAVEKLARRLRLSGLYGFDFMREAQTGNAYLIEINPRTTQVGHLALGENRDLPAALYAAVSGVDAKARPPVTGRDTIALFPQEWIRDAASPFLRSAYHDVPWEAPELVLACTRSYRRRKKWYSPKMKMGDSQELIGVHREFPTNDGSPSSSLGKPAKSRLP